jgi:hypothetical protein
MGGVVRYGSKVTDGASLSYFPDLPTSGELTFCDLDHSRAGFGQFVRTARSTYVFVTMLSLIGTALRLFHLLSSNFALAGTRPASGVRSWREAVLAM